MIELKVIGNPVTQGNKTGFVNKATGRVVMREGRRADSARRFSDWRTDVAAEARRAFEENELAGLVNCPVSVSMDFTMTRPKSHPKRRRTWPVGKFSGDVDKLARAVLDALTGTLLVDDGLVVHLVVNKDYGDPPGVVVSIELAGAKARG